MIVIVIVGILSAVALPNFLNNTNKAKTTEAKTKISAILKEAHAEYQLDGQPLTAEEAADKQAEDNKSDTFTYEVGGVNDGILTVTATANTGAKGDASLADAEAQGQPIDGCVNLTSGKVDIRKSLNDDNPLDCAIS